MLKTLVLFLLICFQCVCNDASDHHHLPDTPIEVKIAEGKKGLLV